MYYLFSLLVIGCTQQLLSDVDVTVEKTKGITKNAALWLRDRDNIVVGADKDPAGSLDKGFASKEDCKKIFEPSEDSMQVDVEGSNRYCEKRLPTSKAPTYYAIECSEKDLMLAVNMSEKEIQDEQIKAQKQEAERMLCIQQHRYDKAATCCRKIKGKPQGNKRLSSSWQGVRADSVSSRCTTLEPKKGAKASPEKEVQSLMHKACIEEERYNEAAKCCREQQKDFTADMAEAAQACSKS